MPEILTFEGPEDFRLRLTLATISAKPIKIISIRESTSASQIGLNDVEAAFLTFLANITDGSSITISPSGTTVTYTPGIIVGGSFTHVCPPARGIGYYLEMLALLLPFAKTRSEITLTGVTNENKDMSVDMFREVTLRQLSYFGIERGEVEVKVLSRGFAPLGGGAVRFKCPAVRALTAVDYSKLSLFSKIRGIAVSSLVPPAMPNRAITAAKGECLKLIPDVQVAVEHAKMKRGGKSRGYGLSLTAETDSGGVVGAEYYLDASAGVDVTPESLGTLVARALLSECMTRGAPDAVHQPLLLCLMALTPEDVSMLRFGPLTARAARTMRLIYQFTGVKFDLQRRVVKSGEGIQETFIFATCRGCGMMNANLRGI
eukprot:gnl/Dysnectes_brevis/1850_a2122_1466.p1 GENE.gnl/Dysnectes_brevis/1850_a2122_1466~~gnl/Dysnectes_brevis/1850_a2122_1466.p1  ORF type:complete len:392 (-),score=109.49 gnl/Dysnectes_brevis/1850_a2122_1466:40-1158(-)